MINLIPNILSYVCVILNSSLFSYYLLLSTESNL